LLVTCPSPPALAFFCHGPKRPRQTVQAGSLAEAPVGEEGSAVRAQIDIVNLAEVFIVTENFLSLSRIPKNEAVVAADAPAAGHDKSVVGGEAQTIDQGAVPFSGPNRFFCPQIDHLNIDGGILSSRRQGNRKSLTVVGPGDPAHLMGQCPGFELFAFAQVPQANALVG